MAWGAAMPRNRSRTTPTSCTRRAMERSVPPSAKGTTPAGEWGDWLSPEAAWQRVLEAWQPRPLDVERVPLLEACGRVLAEDVYAVADSPAFDRSAVDGYAVRAAAVAQASAAAPARLRVIGDVLMGTASTDTVAPKTTAWVATGAMIPAGADGVVMVERTARDGEMVLIQ